MNYEIYTQKTREIVRELAQEIGNPRDEEGAWRILTAVLHALRERVTPDESFNLISQLPMLLKAVYIEGWHPSRHKPKIKNVNEFVNAVRAADRVVSERDFGNEEKAREQLRATFRVLKRHITSGQIEVLELSMPSDLRDFIAAA
jgi:uncharacterized protein (DUF2267 family)